MSEGRSDDIRATDLGRRVRYRREELGLSRLELAQRAGMTEQYVCRLEEQPARFPTSLLLPLARALEIPESVLLGTDAEIPPGRQRAAPHARVRTLSEDECWQMLGDGGIGRIAFLVESESAPFVFPVNYAVAGHTILVRVEAGHLLDTTITRSGPDHAVSFEVDRIDEAQREAWSVLVRGRADKAAGPDNGAEGLRLDPWAGGTRSTLVRLHPGEVTGRRIHAS
ncbi:MAG: helix-turn-helix domain-containing protein [Actinomycetes bacterium]